MTVEMALEHYVRGRGPEMAAPERLAYSVKALAPFWRHLPVSAITDDTCRAYVRDRVEAGRAENTARRELSVLQAAVNWCAKKTKLTATRSVELPPMPDSKQRALTRSEAARLLWAARKRGDRHVMRFILIGLYTGTRASAILGLRLDHPHTTGGWLDLEHGVLHRIGEGERKTHKRRPAARLPRQLLAHARRWRAMGDVWAVAWQGQRIIKVEGAFRACAEDAALGWRPTPHTLKHTSITWAIQAGASIEDISGYFGTSPATILRVYWDKSPAWQASAVEKVERMGRRK